MLEDPRSDVFISALADPAQRLAACLLQASFRAHQSDRAVLVRIHLSLKQCCDPWTVATHLIQDGSPFFLWNDGGAEMCIAAVGALESHNVRPGDRFAETQRICTEFSERMFEVNWNGEGANETDFDGAPLAFSSFSFGTSESSYPWDEWSGGNTLISPLVVYKRKDSAHCSAVLHVLVESCTDLGEEFAACERLIGSLLGQDCSRGYVPTDYGSAHGPEAGGNPTRDRIEWLQKANRARQATAAGVLEKIVLARRAELAAPFGMTFDEEATIHALRREHPSSICFAIRQAGGTCFLGASPEVLVRVSDRTITTHAVAGTTPRGSSKAEDDRLGNGLLLNPKDQLEHRLVVDALTSALEPLCSDLQHSHNPKLLRLPRLQHLETPFSGRLREGHHVLDLVERLHPTPAVAGWPSAKAQAWLAEHESLARGHYAGPIGWINARGDGAFAVAIRSVLISDTTAHTFAGAGIVAASDPQAEWLETELKLQTIRSALQLRPYYDDSRSCRRTSEISIPHRL